MSSEIPGTSAEKEFSFWSVIKLGIFAGMLFGAGYWYSKLTSSPIEVAKVASESIDIEDLKKRRAEYEKVQQRLKLGYYKELTAQPRRNSFERTPISPKTEPSAVAEVAPEPLEPEDHLPEPQAPKVEEQKPSSDRLAKALEKVLGHETPDSVSTAAKVSLPSQTGSAFAIQVASLPDRKVAEELANRLTLKGYEARLVQAQIPGRGLVYRVRIHGFETRREADQARFELSAKERIDGITVEQ